MTKPPEVAKHAEATTEAEATRQARAARRRRHPREETLTPFLERSITELIDLFAQLFTTPFAVLSYSKRFRDQISALAEDDLESAYPETVARPLSFFVLLMSAHGLMLRFYWRMVFPGVADFNALTAPKDQSTAAAAAANPLFGDLAGQMKELYEKIGKPDLLDPKTVIAIGFALTLIIAAKAYFVSMVGHLLRCPIRFRTALHASAYAFGTFIFFQYLFIAVRYLAWLKFGDDGFRYGYALLPYGSLLLSMVLVVRINQIIRQVDGTAELETYGTWFIGTLVWQFAIILFVPYIMGYGSGIGGYWTAYSSFWMTFGQALYPPVWLNTN
jgi:hypothetical protein